MRVLLLGGGGREHALAAALAADSSVTALIASPGNPGIAGLRLAAGGDVVVVPCDIADPAAVVTLAVDHQADLVVVGPEQPLVNGVADAVRAKGIACFGPSRAAARIEGSKSFAKDVMAAAGVPTSEARICRDREQLIAALDAFGPPYVVKADGLAAGKGVIVTSDRQAALAHGAECDQVLVEEYLAGPEVSLFVVADGTTGIPLLAAQDFKRVGDGDEGLNTGGMGAYAPLPWAPPDLIPEIMRSVIYPTLRELDRRGTPFSGLLYAGLVLTTRGPKVIEFNCRFGDPETQPVLALLETPLAGVLHAAATGGLAAVPPLRWRDGAAVTVVIAADGYPGTPRRGDVIIGADGQDDGRYGQVGLLHAGTARRTSDGMLVSAGGRVLCATATGDTLAAARQAAYDLVAGVALAGSHHRRDIALAAVEGRVIAP